MIWSFLVGLDRGPLVEERRKEENLLRKLTAKTYVHKKLQFVKSQASFKPTGFLGNSIQVQNKHIVTSVRLKINIFNYN